MGYHKKGQLEMDVTLYPFQKNVVEFCLSRRYSLVALDCGLGKTLCAMETARRMNARHILIICPASIKLQWKKAILDYLGQPSQVMVTGSDKPTSNIVIVNYDLIVTKRKDRYELFHQLAKKAWDIAIIDESHYLRTANSKRTRLILGRHSFLKNTQKVLLLTGTPVINVPNNLYPILKTFIPERLGEYVNWIPFIVKFCGGHFRPFGWYADGASNLDILSDMLVDFMIRFTKAEVLTQLPPIVESIVPIAIKIKESEKDTHIATLRKLIAEAKCEQIIQLVEHELQTLEKIIVFFYHRNVGDTLFQRLKGAHHNPVIIYGGMSNADRSNSINLYFTDATSKVALLQIHSAGQGLDGFQTVCSNIVFAEIDWSPGVLQQAKDRLHRLGQEKTVFIKYVIAQNTIDERLYDMLGKKQDNIITIMKDNERENIMAKEKEKDVSVSSLEKALSEALVSYISVLINAKLASHERYGVSVGKNTEVSAVPVASPVQVTPPAVIPTETPVLNVTATGVAVSSPAPVVAPVAPVIHLTKDDIETATRILISDLNPTGTMEGKNAAVTWIKENIFIPSGSKMAEIDPKNYEAIYEKLLDPKTPLFFLDTVTEEAL